MGPPSGRPPSGISAHIDIMQRSPVMHALIPPSAPPMVVQQGWPAAPHAPQVPGASPLALRPAHPNPIEQVPVLPVPQHGSPEPPQVPHAVPLVASMQLSPLVQALTPPSPGAPIVVQQAWPEAPQAPHLPVVPAPVFRPLQPKPLEHVPVPPIPQQAWPEAPHAAHWLPPAAITQLRPLVHAICPVQQG
jgi:hypothetical protein